MLARKSSTQLRDEIGDLIKNPRRSLPPIRSSNVNERIHVDVRIARVTEYHPTNSVAGQTRANAADIIGESVWRNGAVLDELHRAE